MKTRKDKVKTKYGQLVIRLIPSLERRFERLAKKRGLTKAAWARQGLIKLAAEEERLSRDEAANA